MKILPLLAAVALVAFPAVTQAQFIPPSDDSQNQAVSSSGTDNLDAVRFAEFSDGNAELQTVVLTLRNQAGVKIDLVAAIHIGDAAYYDQLNQRLRAYDVVLYELVGGPWEPNREAPGGEMNHIQTLQRIAKTFMGFEYQLDGINYSAPNFVHADVTAEELQALFASRNESMLTFLMKAAALEGNEEVMAEMEAMKAEELTSNLFSALLEFNPNGVKRNLAPLLSNSEMFIDHLEGETGSVLIAERNKVVMTALDDQIGRGERDIAVFYGAGHLPDLVERLEARGYALSGETWLAAWELGPEQPATGGITLETVGDLLKDDAVVDGILGFLQEFGQMFQ